MLFYLVVKTKLTLKALPVNQMKKYSQYFFPATCVITIIMAFTIGGIILGGVFMGLVSTIALWMTIQKFPKRIQGWIGKHPLIADACFLKISLAVFALIGAGPTMFMALMTQAVLLGLLLKTLEERQDNGNESSITVVDATHRSDSVEGGKDGWSSRSIRCDSNCSSSGHVSTDATVPA